MLAPGQLIPVTIEKPAAGGRMIARVNGQIMLVSGAIPGERVTARVERIGKGVVYSAVASVDEASADRREPSGDPECGGCLYAHVAYPRQLSLKAEVIADACARLGRFTAPSGLAVKGSAAEGYRMRARLHVRDGRAGFFREGTHALCDARATRQLLPGTSDVIEALCSTWPSLGLGALHELEVSENVEASERAVHATVSGADGSQVPVRAMELPEGLTGLSLGTPASSSDLRVMAGGPFVTETLRFGTHAIRLRRHVLAFFQGNRFLLSDLVVHVMNMLPPASAVLDLYAGTGLFAVTAAVEKGARVSAVEGDPVAAEDLRVNAQAMNAVTVTNLSVERFLAKSHLRPDVLIVDPPRTGMSKEALSGAVGLSATRVIYVSCDVATLARDARRLLDAGYTLTHMDAFDLFPNTPHVETIAVFERF